MSTPNKITVWELDGEIYRTEREALWAEIGYLTASMDKATDEPATERAVENLKLSAVELERLCSAFLMAGGE